jgi:transposase-like protein
MAGKPMFTALPAPNTRRWIARRKAAVVAAVGRGEITIEEACRRYRLSIEEFRSWERGFVENGLAGLQVGYRQRRRSASTGSRGPAARGFLPAAIGTEP